MRGNVNKYSKIIVVADDVPVNENKKANKIAVKTSLNELAKSHGTQYEIFHCQSKSDLNLQITDYLGWAIFQKWEDNDGEATKQ